LQLYNIPNVTQQGESSAPRKFLIQLLTNHAAHDTRFTSAMKPMSGLQELLLRRNCCLQHSTYGSPLLNSDNHRKTGKAQHAFRMQTAAIMMHLIIYIFLCNMLLLMCDEDSKTACNETTCLLSNAILSHFFWWCHQSYDLAHNCSDLDFSHNWPQMSNWGVLSQHM